MSVPQSAPLGESPFALNGNAIHVKRPNMMMQSQYLRCLCVSLVFTALLAACSKKEEVTSRDITAQTVGMDGDLPKECVDALQAQRECTENLAAKYERVGHPEAGKQLRDALPKELDKVKAIWRSVQYKEELAKRCAMTRDSLHAQLQCQP